MGSTILQSLNKWQDGLLLFESFESPNFMQDQAWTLLNGTPKTSNEVEKDGLRSFKLDLTYPWIEKDFTGFTDPNFQYSHVWFFDDAAVLTGGFTPFVQWVAASSGVTFGLGVDLSVSTVNYTYEYNGGRHDSFIPRSDGFHMFSLVSNTDALQTDILIDGTSAYQETANLRRFRKIRLGCIDASGTEAFGYFDEVIATLLLKVFIYGVDDGTTGTITGDGIGVSVAPASGGVLEIAVGTPGTIEGLYTGVLALTKADGVTPYCAFASQDYAFGDFYQLDVYDFGRKPSALNFKDEDMRNDLKATLGVKQSVFFNDSDRVSMTFEDLTEAQKNRLDRWWTNAKRGNGFGVAIDSDATYFGAVTAGAGNPTSLQITVLPKSGPAVGSKMVLRDNDGQNKQTAEVQLVTIFLGSAILELTEPPVGPKQTGQQIRSLYYWPFCTSTDKSLNATLTNLTLNKWTVTINFEEAIL